MGIVSAQRGAAWDLSTVRRGRAVRSKLVGWITAVMIVWVMLYAVCNTVVVRRDLARAEAYRLELTEKTAALREENQRLEREIALAEDAAVIEEIARNRLGLEMSGEIIFCDIEASVSGERE